MRFRLFFLQPSLTPFMKYVPLTALAALFLALLPLSAQTAAPAPAPAPAAVAEADPTPTYLDPAQVDVTFLGNPPADGSAQTKAEIEQLLQLQATRTPEQVARAASEAKLKPEAFAGILGSWFTKENAPATFALLAAAKDDTKLVSKKAKQLWKRPRPPLQDARIQPAVELEKTTSYPSGHSTLGTVWSLVLAEIVPDKATDLQARGREIGDDRLLAGVHFPTDVEAGRKLGAAIVKQFQASPAFQAEVAKAKAEIAAARTKVPVVTK